MSSKLIVVTKEHLKKFREARARKRALKSFKVLREKIRSTRGVRPDVAAAVELLETELFSLK